MNRIKKIQYVICTLNCRNVTQQFWCHPNLKFLTAKDIFDV